jgi:hypothetical protein
MIRIEIADLLFATSRSGYDYGANVPVSPELIFHWIAEVKSIAAKSIICVLNDQHLKLYGGLPAGLLQAYTVMQVSKSGMRLRLIIRGRRSRAVS